MQELNSYQIRFHRPLKTNQIMKMYKLISRYNCHMYLHQNQLIADGNHLPKLLSFFLLVNIDEPILLIIDGENAGLVYDEVKEVWKENILNTSCRKKYTETMINSNSSITV